MPERKRARPPKPSGPGRETIYQEVTDRIIAELEAGRVPWVQPWGAARAGIGLPRNAATARRYSGINILILWGAVIEKGYSAQHWLTFRQALSLGGHVRKGERGTTVVYADRFIPKGEQQRAAEAGDGEAEQETLPGSVSRPNRAVPFLKRFTVFNVDQCDGLPQGICVGRAPLPEREAVPVAEALIAATGADFRIGGARAFYVPSADYIQVPPQPAFFGDNDAEVGNFVRRIAEELGYEMNFTAEPTDFGRHYRSFNPDLVILDLGMPKVDGIELLHLLAEERCRAFVLLMSGLAPEMRDAALRLGRAYCLEMVGIVAKPVRASELREVLNGLRRADRGKGISGTVAPVSADFCGRESDIHLAEE
jgi:antirestriction protein ArdC